MDAGGQDAGGLRMPPSDAPSPWPALVGFLLVALTAGVVGNLAQGDDVAARYLMLDRPVWAPPSAAFGLVWPILYVMIGVAGWRVWRVGGGLPAVRLPLTLWLVQLAVNAMWPGVFFGAGAFGPAIAVIVALDLVVVATILAFRRVDAVAAWLLVPYLAWLGYATALNIAIWAAN